VTPFDWTRGRLFATAASLLVLISGQVLKWQEPCSALAGAIQRLLLVLQVAAKSLFFRKNSVSELQRINMQSP